MIVFNLLSFLINENQLAKAVEAVRLFFYGSCFLRYTAVSGAFCQHARYLYKEAPHYMNMDKRTSRPTRHGLDVHDCLRINTRAPPQNGPLNGLLN